MTSKMTSKCDKLHKKMTDAGENLLFVDEDLSWANYGENWLRNPEESFKQSKKRYNNLREQYFQECYNFPWKWFINKFPGSEIKPIYNK